MPNTAMIGRSGIAVTVTTGSQSSLLRLRIEIYSDRIQVYHPVSSATATDLFTLLETTAGGQPFTATGQGYLNLVSLPAAPRAAFYNVSLNVTADTLTLRVIQPEPFARRANAFFKELDLQFTGQKTAPGVSIAGSVKIVLFEQELTLVPTVNDIDGLIFALSTPLSVAIAQLGQLNISALKVGNNRDRWAELRAFYAFDEPSDSLTTNGTLFLDSSGSRDQNDQEEPPLNLQLSTPATITSLSTPLSHGIAVKSGTEIQSVGQATKLVKACQRTQEITIEAWIKPSATFISKSDQRPARIVTFSKDTSDSNFTLGQDVEDANGNANHFYVTRLRRTGNSSQSNANSDNNGDPRLRARPEAFVRELSHVVFTRNSAGLAQLYINGVDQTLGLYGDRADLRRVPPISMTGNFNGWKDNFQLVLANELTKNRPWEGEFHQVALYSRALSKDEIFNSYYPAIQIEATLTLDHVPAPLNVPLPVIIANNVRDSLLTVTQPVAPVVLNVADFFTFKQVNFNWRKTATTLELLSGNIKATLWGKELEFSASLTADRITLVAKPETLTFPDLGIVTLAQLHLQGDRTIPNPTWSFQPDGQVTLAILPPPLRGPFPIQLSLEGQDLWLSIDPPPPLTLVEQIGLSRAHLRFKRIADGWEPQSGQAGILLPLSGQSLPLTPKFSGETPQRLLLEWVAPAVALPGFGGAFGTLLPTQVQLKVGTPTNVFWQFALKGRLPLKLADADELASVLDVALDGRIVGNPNNLRQATRLEGTTSLQSLMDGFFTGDLTLKGDRFSSTGRVILFPDWSLLQVQGEAQLTLAADGKMHFQAPVQVTLPNFVLSNPQLTLGNGRLALDGTWLGNPISFTAIQRANQSIWEDEVLFHLPFSLTVGPIYEPGTNLKLADLVRVCQEPNCRQVMTINTRIELSSSGFLAALNSAFQWRDETATIHDLTVPEINLFTPPPTRNQLLGPVLDTVRDQANPIFAVQFKHVDDYIFSTNTRSPVVSLGDRTHSTTELISKLPKVFVADTGRVSDTVSVIQLRQSVAACELVLRVGNQPQSALITAFNEFLILLARQERSGALIPGAIALIQRRLAERLPATFNRMLYYYYGFDLSQGCIDLQPGMRLRVDFQNYQNVPTPDRTARSGFVGSGTSYYSITSYPHPVAANGQVQYRNLLGFDPFVSGLQSLINTDIATTGASGMIDLLKPGFRQPYYRLFYPRDFAAGSNQPERAITIVGATNLAEMQNATEEYQQTAAVKSSADRVSFFFRGRVVVIPEITVFVQEQPIFVSVGTTFRQLIERFAGIPTNALREQNLSSFQGRLKPRRLVHDDTTSTPSYKFINFDSYQQYDDGMDIFDLPVVEGDRIYV